MARVPGVFMRSVEHRRYVVNQLRKHFGFEGVPIRVAYRDKRRGKRKGAPEAEEG